MVEMKTRRFFVGGNWKMNGNLALIRTIVESTLKELPQGLEVDIILAPPTPYLATLKTACDGIGMVQIAAQNVHEKSAGAFTGEISVTMLEDLHIPWTIIGHSERRTLFGESNELIGEKLDTVFSSNGLKAVVCVGESLQERESGITAQVLCAQLAALPMEGWNDRVVIAYEPVWAIGTGKAEEAHKCIRNWIALHLGDSMASQLRIIYGGSVTAVNCRELAKVDDIDGFLVGGASLKPEFRDIVLARL